MREELKPIEQHGFTLVDFLPDGILLRFFTLTGRFVLEIANIRIETDVPRSNQSC
jgi:hypothetical protein